MIGWCAGVLWILKRAQQARQLIFGYFEGHRYRTAAALSTIQAQSNWTFLKAFSFGAKGLERNSHGEYKKDYKSDPALPMLDWVIGNAKQLTCLRLDHASPEPIPPLSSLKHLQVMVNEDSWDICTCLSEFCPNLTTLSVCCCAADDLARPKLYLDRLTKLHSLMLDDFVPSTLTLAGVTALHLRLYSFDDVDEDVWVPHASQLRSLCVTARYEHIHAANKLPNILLNSRAPGLESLTLIAESIGCKEAPFHVHGALLQVQQLHLHTTSGMHLDIPGGLFHWHRLYVTSEHKLSIRMRSVPDFAESCRAFSISYANLPGGDLLRMCSYMSAQSRPWAHTVGPGRSVVHSSGVPLLLEICCNVYDMWRLLENSHLTPDGIVPGTC